VKPVFVKTFGCKVNYAESGAFGDLLRRVGYTPLDVQGSDLASPDEVERPVVFVNSCCVTLEAERKAAQFVRSVKRRYPQSTVLFTGCAARNHTVRETYTQAGAEVFDFYPQAFDWLMEHTRGVRTDWHSDGRRSFTGQQPDGEQPSALRGPRSAEPVGGAVINADRGLRTADASLPTGIVAPARARAFIKVQDGCHNCCTFCIIPFVRPYASRPFGEVIDEAQRKLDEGHRELVLTGVNIGHYGLTPVASIGEVASDKLWGRGKLYAAVPGHPTLCDLIDALLAILGDSQRLRISSIEPEDLTPRFFEQLRHPRMCPHLHLPLQSGSDKVLADMRRLYTAADYRAIAAQFRRACPAGALTTDIMAGFPTETLDDFAQTLELVSEAQFEKVHAFPYSPRPGTRAGRLPQLPRAEILSRNRRLIAHSQSVADAQWLRRVGSTAEVLLEDSDAGSGTWAGHGAAYEAVELPLGAPLAAAGAMLRVRLERYAGQGRFAAALAA
jgi:threonylcarbamoyladenosine tRNA methylthiotransferase MtaB